MPKYGQLVIGPAGSGKSTYCSAIVKHCEAIGRVVHVINLDPAAEVFDYPVAGDVRDLISVEDVLDDDDLHLGPNGGLVFCIEYLNQNTDWLSEIVGEIDDEYFLFDCPGQMELYTHMPVMRQLVDNLRGMDVMLCSVYLLDAHFLLQTSNFIGGVLSALSTMIGLELPHFNVLSKLDLLNPAQRLDIDRYLEADLEELLDEDVGVGQFSLKYQKMTYAIANLVTNFSLVRFLGLDITEEDSISELLCQIDNCIQYGEDLEPKGPKDECEPLETVAQGENFFGM